MSSEKLQPTDRGPLVSVVIPTRNRCALLKRALESVAGQRYDNLEVIVIDDDSGDATAGAAAGYRGRFKAFKYLRNETSLGAAACRNIGIKNSTGEYIAFLDDDDEWLPDKTVMQIRLLEGDPSTGAVSCWYRRIGAGGGVTRTRLIPAMDFNSMLWENFMGSFSFCMVRSGLAKKTMLDPGLRSSQDWQFWLELSRVTKLGAVEDYLVDYHDHPGQRISKSYSSKLSGLRRFFLRYRKEMTPECRRYWLTYLMLYKIVNSGIRFKLKFINGFFKILKDPTSRFVLKKILLLRAANRLRLGRAYDPANATYRYAKGTR